jgi:dTDP-4-dehydrorhamnose reductase
MSDLMITGGSGFVGSNLARYFTSKKKITISYFQSSIPKNLLGMTDSVYLDIRDVDEVLNVIEKRMPKIVIHVAGNKNVSYCEKYPEEAYQTNALGTKNIATACRKFDARMIYISTDLVFSCTDGFYKENDQPNPSLVYGKTKLQGEEFVLNELDNNAVICRSGGIYGTGSPLLDWLSSELTQDRTVQCFTDVFNTPTYTENLAEMIEVIIENNLSGIFHTVGRERVNRFQLFNYYATMFNLNVKLLAPAQAGIGRERMLLQSDSSLSIEETANRLFGVSFNSVQEGFSRLKVLGDVSCKDFQLI